MGAHRLSVSRHNLEKRWTKVFEITKITRRKSRTSERSISRLKRRKSFIPFPKRNNSSMLDLLVTERKSTWRLPVLSLPLLIYISEWSSETLLVHHIPYEGLRIGTRNAETPFLPEAYYNLVVFLFEQKRATHIENDVAVAKTNNSLYSSECDLFDEMSKIVRWFVRSEKCWM